MRQMMILALCVCLGGLVACGPANEGELSLGVWGEEFIEDVIPASEVADGWKIEFTTFLIVAGNVQLSDASGQTGPLNETVKVFNLKQKGEQALLTKTLTGGEWKTLQYSVFPASATTQAASGVSDEQLQMMKQMGYSIYLEGTASKGSETKTFKWGFQTATTYKKCQPTAPLTGSAKAQLTIHADHFFYDDLEDPDAQVKFQVFADADADGNGEVTMEELSSFGGAKFAALDRYQVGRFTDVKDLKAFVTHLSRTLGHIDGEGHCDIALD